MHYGSVGVFLLVLDQREGYACLVLLQENCTVNFMPTHYGRLSVWLPINLVSQGRKKKKEFPVGNGSEAARRRSCCAFRVCNPICLISGAAAAAQELKIHTTHEGPPNMCRHSMHT